MRSHANSFVVVRPFLDNEASVCPPTANYPREVLAWDGKDGLTLLDPQEDFAPRKNGVFKGLNVLWQFKGGASSVNRDHPACTQKDVYERVVKPMLPSIVDGYNAAFLIAGGAGSGRTYALYGDSVDGSSRGILPRFAEDIFDAFDALKHDNSFLSTQVEVIEISGEQYVDLLAVKRSTSNGRKDDGHVEMKVVPGSEGPRLQGATEVEVKGSVDLRNLMKQITRTVRKRNATHTVTFRFTETFEFEDPNHYGQSISQSRRIQVTFILLSNVPPGFQRCIDVAVEHDSGENPLAKVPVRETALTKLFPGVLQQEFALTFISCVSPYYETVRETLSSLQFATKVRKLIGYPQLNQDEELVDMRRLADEVKNLKIQVRKQSQAMTVVQQELNSREVELMKQEARYNDMNRAFAEAQENLKLLTIGRNMEADRTRVFRKDMDAQLKAKKKEMQLTQNARGAKDMAYEQVMRDADDAKIRTEAIEARTVKQKENTAIYRKRLEDYQAEERAVKDLEDFNIASPDEQERILGEWYSVRIGTAQELKKIREEETAVKSADTTLADKAAIQADYDKVYAEEGPVHEKERLLKEIKGLEKEIADAEAETRRMQAEIDQRKAQCGCSTM